MIDFFATSFNALVANTEPDQYGVVIPYATITLQWMLWKLASTTNRDGKMLATVDDLSDKIRWPLLIDLLHATALIDDTVLKMSAPPGACPWQLPLEESASRGMVWHPSYNLGRNGNDVEGSVLEYWIRCLQWISQRIASLSVTPGRIKPPLKFHALSQRFFDALSQDVLEEPCASEGVSDSETVFEDEVEEEAMSQV